MEDKLCLQSCVLSHLITETATNSEIHEKSHLPFHSHKNHRQAVQYISNG